MRIVNSIIKCSLNFFIRECYCVVYNGYILTLPLVSIETVLHDTMLLPSGCLKPYCVFQLTKPRPMLKSAVERVQKIKEVDNQGG